jgi:alpha-tubulin suppressor-like RCC1 family protein
MPERRTAIAHRLSAAAPPAFIAAPLVVLALLAFEGSAPSATANVLTGAVAVSGGGAHTCAILEGGAVDCWGWNQSGQLGDRTTTDRAFPVGVPGMSGATLVATGAAHTCVYIPPTGVKCAGLNAWGQLGGPATDQCGGIACSTGPVDVGGLVEEVVSLGAGVSHTCALTADGGVKCWGRNQYGQLGDGTSVNSGTPVDVSGLGDGAVALSVGAFHNCVLLMDSRLQCWGQDLLGQLGDGAMMNSPLPVDVSGLPAPATSVSAGYQHTCAVLGTGGVMCWGDNIYGKLGDGTSAQRSTPVAVAGLESGVEAVTAADDHSCALTSAGGLLCWGQNSYGQLGDGTLMRRHTPVDVVGLGSDVSALWRGFLHTCASTTDGMLNCWGDNVLGQLGVVTDQVCVFSAASCSSVPLDVVLSPKATPTPSPSRTSTATVTPTPALRAGDVDCDGAVTAIDAALVLQLGAGLLDSLDCESAGDVNDDGRVDAIDAALILQHVAGLLDSLPV